MRTQTFKGIKKCQCHDPEHTPTTSSSAACTRPAGCQDVWRERKATSAEACPQTALLGGLTEGNLLPLEADLQLLLFSWCSHPEPCLSCATAMHAIDPDPGQQTYSPAGLQAFIMDLPGHHWSSTLHPDLTLALTYHSSKSVKSLNLSITTSSRPHGLAFYLPCRHSTPVATHTACSNKASLSFSNSAHRASLKRINSGPHFLYSLPCISTNTEEWHMV